MMLVPLKNKAFFRASNYLKEKKKYMIHGDTGFNLNLYPCVLATIKGREGSSIPQIFRY